MNQRGETKRAKTPAMMENWIKSRLSRSHSFLPLVAPFSSGLLCRFDAFHLIPLNDIESYFLLFFYIRSADKLSARLDTGAFDAKFLLQ